MFATLAMPAEAQSRNLTGTVTAAATGQPLANAEVVVTAEGRAVASTTRSDGTFTVQIPAGEATVTVRMLGYRSEDLSVGPADSNLEVALETDALRLDEIVVTGQATGVQRRNLANAVSTVTADQLNVVPTASIETQLAGKVPGVDIQANSGAPGGGNQVSLRGVSTIFGGSTPLYVVDGVIISDAAIASGTNSVTEAGGGIANMQDNPVNRIADLNPADIESVQILKGGSAAAIYGSRANNGVIIISTRRGQTGETTFNLTQRFGVSQLSRKIGTRAFTESEAIERYGEDAAAFFSDDASPFFDLEEALAGGNAPAYETMLSMSGGTEDTRYYASGLVRNEDGILKGTYANKYSLMLNLDQNISDRIGLQLSTNAVRTQNDRGFTNNDNTSTSYYMAWSSTPSFVDLSRLDDGTYPFNPFANSNPLQTAEMVKNEQNVSRFVGSARLTFDAVHSDEHELRLTGLVGGDIFSQTNQVYSPENLQFECVIGPNCSPTDDFPGTSVLSKSTSSQYNADASAVHTYLPASGLFSATTSAGVQYAYRDVDIFRVQATDLFPGQQNVNQAVNRVPLQDRERTKDLGVYFQEEVLIRDRLLLTGSVRADRSSNNVETDKWFLYPKASASYRFSVRRGVLDELKLRMAVGQSGLQPQYGDKFNNLNPDFTGGLQTLELDGTIAAPDLRPERQTEIEGGFDAQLLSGRLGLEFTAFHQRVDDLILTRTLASSSGFNNEVFNNDGWMTSHGFEVAMHALPVESGDFAWNAGVTFSSDRTVMDSLSVPAFNAPGAGFGTSLGAVRIQQGKSVTQIVGRDTVAVTDDPRCLDALDVDAGGDECEPGTRFETALGDANPDFRMGFTNNFRWRSLSLATTVDWQQGGTINNLTGFLLDANQISEDFKDPCDFDDCLDGETKGEYRNRVYPARTTKVFLEDATFVKLREVALTWQVPSALLANALFGGIDGASVTVSGRNLLTYQKYSGFDPEVNNFGNQAIRANIDVAPYPPSRTFWLSVNVRF